MDQLDAITLLYLSKHWDGNGSLQDCARTFHQTKKMLAESINGEIGERIDQRLRSGESFF